MRPFDGGPEGMRSRSQLLHLSLVQRRAGPCKAKRRIAMHSSGIETDLDGWPIVVHRTLGTPTDVQVDAFIRQADMLLDRGEPYVVVFDSTDAGRVSPYMRQQSMAWLKTHGVRLGEHCRGTALVFPSAAFRFVLSTVLLVSPAPVPHSVCGTLREALDWARRQLGLPSDGDAPGRPWYGR